MNQYNPEESPKAEDWLALDEQERVLLVEYFHRDARIPLPKRARRIHASLHAVVENQVAVRDQPVVQALERLTGEGVTRHEAIHAIGSVLVRVMRGVMNSESPGASASEDYYAELARLTRQSCYGEQAG
ncbi:MAG: hypothetical protein GC151_18680 [Betaproteobacteria bacterium]|nr:hypothetical protein [Betaproteobacteria bacterium]